MPHYLVTNATSFFPMVKCLCYYYFLYISYGEYKDIMDILNVEFACAGDVACTHSIFLVQGLY